eukprot:SAG31_NODE_150_length_22290_cov_5.975801_27_plen_104_part_00
MIKHIGLDWNWHLNRTAQRTILDLQLPTGLWSSGSKPGKGLLSRFCATIREIRDFNREKYGTDRESVCINQATTTSMRYSLQFELCRGIQIVGKKCKLRVRPF